MTTSTMQNMPKLEIPASPTLQEYLAHSPTVCAPSNEDACPICYEAWNTTPDAIIQTHCGHNFHRECLTAWFGNENVENANTCPSCRAVCFPNAPEKHTHVQINGERSPNANDISFLFGTMYRVA
jgi:hypothetical protein